MEGKCSVISCLRQAADELRPSASAQLDAELLLSNLLSSSRTSLYTDEKRKISVSQKRSFLRLVRERKGGKPISYILGRAEFWSLPFKVTSDVLVPRPETETLVETVLDLTREKKLWRILELGTGCGAVAAALQTELRDAQILATDISLPALQVAQNNFKKLGLRDIKIAAVNWLESIGTETFDCIVANPPYVGEQESNIIDREIYFEPTSAIFSGKDGLEAVTIIVRDAYRCLRHGGVLTVEHGYSQGKKIQELLKLRGFTRLNTIKDLGRRERVTYGIKVK